MQSQFQKKLLRPSKKSLMLATPARSSKKQFESARDVPATQAARFPKKPAGTLVTIVGVITLQGGMRFTRKKSVFENAEEGDAGNGILDGMSNHSRPQALAQVRHDSKEHAENSDG